MPSFPCAAAICCNYVPKRGTRCSSCGDTPADPARPSRHRIYDLRSRDKEAKRFYDSAAWRRARAAKLAAVPWCERCRATLASHVHHKKPLADCTPGEAIDQGNLFSSCPPCHNTIEAEARKAAEREQRAAAGR